MTKKQNIKKVMEFIDSIDWLFQINNFDRKIKIPEDDNEKEDLAEVSFEEDYQRIIIYLYPHFFKQELKDQRKALLHELCHTITMPLANTFDDFIDGKAVTKETIRVLSERSTSQIENILDGLLQGRKKYALEAYKEYLD